MGSQGITQRDWFILTYDVQTFEKSGGRLVNVGYATLTVAYVSKTKQISGGVQQIDQDKLPTSNIGYGEKFGMAIAA